MKTVAAILVEQKSDLVIDEVEIPTLSYGQVLVRIGATRVCGSQLGEIDGVKGPDRYLPHLLGHEAGGVVVETGPEVSHVKTGDRVVLHWRPGKGIEAKGAKYAWRGRSCNAGAITTFQEYAVISENRLTRVPEHVSFAECSLLADTITTGFGLVNHDATVRIGESVVVIGVGGIGLGAVWGAHLAGANPIVAVDLHAHKLEAAKTFGATHTVLNYSNQFRGEIEAILGGKADVVIDGTAHPAILAEAYDLTGPQGRCVIFGVMHHEKRVSINTLPLHFGKTLTGSQGGGSQPALDIPRYLRLFRARNLDASAMISHRTSLSQINEAISSMRRGESIHTLIEFPGLS